MNDKWIMDINDTDRFRKTFG